MRGAKIETRGYKRMERPNLKICIENDVDSESDEEKPIIEDFEDDEESEESEDGEIYSSKHSQSGSEEESDSDVGDNKSVNDARSGTEATLEVSADHKLLVMFCRNILYVFFLPTCTGMFKLQPAP